MSEFERVPVEVFHLILGELPLSDVFKCRCICKKWLALVNGYYLRSLVVSGSGLPLSDRSFDTCQKVNPLNLVRRGDLFRDQLQNQMFANLRQLYVYEQKIDVSFIAELNCLRNLELLEICKLRLDRNCTLSLPKLRKLHLSLDGKLDGRVTERMNGELDERLAERMNEMLDERQTTEQLDERLTERQNESLDEKLNEQLNQKPNENENLNEITICLDCPQLRELKLNRIKFARILYPDRLVSVHVLHYDPQLKELVNLRQLSISALHRNDLEDDFLANLTKLERLFFEGEGVLFRVLHRQMTAFGRRFRIYQFGVCHRNRPRNLVINYDHLLTEQRVRFYANRLLAGALPVINCVEFNERLFDKLPNGFITRLTGLKTVKVFEPVRDERKLIAFLERCGNVLRLHLIYSQFSSQFFARLARLTPFLAELKLNHFGQDPLDLRFLCELPFLRVLITRNRLSLDQLKSVFEHLKLLRQIEFRFALQDLVRENLSALQIVTLKIVLKSSKRSYRLEVVDGLKVTGGLVVAGGQKVTGDHEAIDGPKMVDDTVNGQKMTDGQKAIAPLKFTSQIGLLWFVEHSLAESLWSK